MSTLAPKPKRSTAALAPTTTVRVYYRQSLGMDKQQSIPTQEGENDRLRRALGISDEQWARAVIYKDVDRSGGDFVGREDFNRLMRETQPGDTIITWKHDRIGRDIIDSATAIRDLVQRRKCLLYTSERGTMSIKCDSAQETMMVLFSGFGGQQGREDIRKNTRDGLRQRARDGFATGSLPFGYRTVLVDPNVTDRKKSKKRIEIDDTLAPIVRRIFATYLDGHDGRGCSTIAKRLTGEGVPGPRGRGWSPTTVWQLLRDPRYVGDWSHGERRVVRREGKRVITERAPEEDVIRSQRPELAIIPRDEWDRAQAAMVERATDMRAQLDASTHTLSGITRCVCHAGLSVQKDGRPGKKVTVYQCSTRRQKGKDACSAKFRILTTVLEDAVRAALIPWVNAAQEAIASAVAEVEARLAAEGAPDVGSIDRELAQAKAQQTRLVKLAAMTDGEVDAIAVELKTGAAAIRRLESAHARATAPRADTKAIGAQIQAVATQRLDDLRRALSGPDAKEALRSLFPGGLHFFIDGDGYRIEADGVLQAIRDPDGSRSACRIPFRVTIPRKAAA